MRHQARHLRGLTALFALLLVMLTTALPAQEAPPGAREYGELAELLENETTRQQLIDQLRGLQAAANPAPLGVAGEVPPSEIAAQAPSGQTRCPWLAVWPRPPATWPGIWGGSSQP